VVRRYQERDSRVRLVVLEHNEGIPRTRNRGLDLARGEYLAHADSDDTSMPQRLEHQVAFLDARPEIAAVGSWVLRTDESGRSFGGPLLRPTDPRVIRGRILFASCFKNPTMLGRTEIMRAFGFREPFVISSDIDLWARISEKHALANLPEFLVRYRAGGTSHQASAPRTEMRQRIARDMLAALGVDFDELDVANHVKLRNLSSFDPTPEYLLWAEGWLERLLDTNARTQAYPEPEFSQAAAERWGLLQARAIATGNLPSGLSALPSRAFALASALPTYLELARGFATAQGLRVFG
jgi:glycosyltransferase involved in cell wall biosynthesis